MNFKLLRRLSSYLILLTTLSAVALAQQPQTPSVDRLREIISYLASDRLEGRRTGSSGANLAAEYIAREFARYRLRRSIGVDLPGMSILEADSPRRYMQEFPFVAGVELGKGNQLWLHASDRSVELHVAEDWMPLGFSSNGRIENAEYLFVGYGITAAELKYDSYYPAVKDRIAIALAGTPDGDNPHGQFARYEDVRWKAIAARNAGAKALLMIAQEENFKEDRLSRLRYDNSAGDAGLPVAVISRQTAARLFSSSGDPKDALSALAEAAKIQPKDSGSLNSAMINSLPFKGATLSIHVDIVRHEVTAANVIGILDGSDPNLKNEAIVIGAHYDHLGRGGEGSLAPREGEIHHGADDNASGVAGLLELARIFSSQQPKPRRSIIFIAFSGEEEGLLGSSSYVNHPIVPLANTVAMINMDMIGRMKANNLIIGGIGTAQGWRSMIETANLMQGVTVTATGTTPEENSAASNKYPMVISANGRTIVSSDAVKQFQLTLNEDGYGPSDHSSFYAKQIPVLFFWTGSHEDYHKPSDTADKINYQDEARVVSFVAQVIQDLDKSEKRPAYTVAKSEAAGRATGFRVYLGTIPNYADSSDGVLLDGVRDDSPAAQAGIKAGDRVVKLAGRDVRNVYDYTYALGEMKAGQEYEVEVVRGTQRLKLRITPAARK